MPVDASLTVPAIFNLQILTSSSVPSTLVKCLYLFFDLPKEEESSEQQSESEFSAKERRILLQKMFIQVRIDILAGF